MAKQKLPISFFLLFLSAVAFGQAKYSNEFLAIGINARAQGMSNAVCAHTDDLTAAYWNPAGLTEIKSPLQVGAMHAEWFAGIGKFDYIGFAKSLNKTKSSYLAFSLIRLGIDQIPYTINLYNEDGSIDYNNISEFSAADYAFFASYGQKLRNPNLSMGGSFKIIRRVVGTFGGAWGFGADLGVQYKKGHWRFGIQGRDLTTTVNAWSFNLTEEEKKNFQKTNNEIPSSNTEITRPKFILGAAWQKQLSKKVGLLTALDVDWTTDGQRNVLISSKGLNLDPKLGFELDYDHFVQLRGGVGNFQRATDDFNPDKKITTLQPNFGIGLKLGRVQLDYALTDIGNVSQTFYSHIFSLRIDLKSRQKQITE